MATVAGKARGYFLQGGGSVAVEARRIGLVHEVVPEAELGAACDRVVATLLTSAPEAVGVAKRLIDEVTGKNPDEAMPITVRTIAERRPSAGAKGGLTAFLESRPPAWAPKKTPR